MDEIKIPDETAENVVKSVMLLKELAVKIGEIVKPISEKLVEFINTLEPYQRHELLHPRKKPRGSLRKLRKQRKEQNERLF